LEHLDLKCPITTQDDLCLLNEHLNIPWSQLKSISLLNRDTWERHCCPLTAILMECSQLERFQWDGHSDTFETSATVLSFVMSQNLQELVIESDPQGCQVLMEKLLYRGNVIRRINVSHIDIQRKRPYMEESFRHWTHITISEGDGHQPWCRFGCRLIEDTHHIFVRCPKFTTLRESYSSRLHQATRMILTTYNLPPQDIAFIME
jgi:hypothetical protein